MPMRKLISIDDSVSAVARSGMTMSVRASPKCRIMESRFLAPGFFYYALAEGLRLMFARRGRWTRYAPDEPSPQLEFALDWG